MWTGCLGGRGRGEYGYIIVCRSCWKALEPVFELSIFDVAIAPPPLDHVERHREFSSTAVGEGWISRKRMSPGSVSTILKDKRSLVVKYEVREGLLCTCPKFWSWQQQTE